MCRLLPPTLLTLLFALPALSHASPQPALVRSDYEISLIPRHTLFLRQLADLQTFDQALGGSRASAITNSGDPQRPFSVEGDTFDSFQSAAQRSCDRQFQACQGVANGGGNGGGGNQGNGNRNNNNGGNNAQNRDRNRKGKRQDDGRGNGNGSGNGNGNNKRQEGGLTVQQCDQQKNECNSVQQSAQVKDFQTGVASTNIGPDPAFPDFDLICEG
ncbi:hypothetical protein CC86DRAFT_278513 [Ophiobolus disseminans]|uniref:Uncharacterized protein n=1 Tax=Ophiobolus disseminans TaxID=1469910 RepID=A0A6A7AKC6_9PLEO|nr:hypothetical protein CC86DRAFT_278513 [Ophiobolus disseminans]